ncbi:hypothetical protein, partial [Streptomyces europaeiscabiei]|uniref:hypothetical protein n=1 Tax=Streptomyces europaeiscabiei TaxID=146819 RepID=UPI0029A3EE30
RSYCFLSFFFYFFFFQEKNGNRVFSLFGGLEIVLRGKPTSPTPVINPQPIPGLTETQQVRA